uniref:G-protein coupled receptors family 1 profile domain-containing protein n=1 Tax=Ciona savignyi TaxID=51511 RepID=H2YCB6_CIOSA
DTAKVVFSGIICAVGLIGNLMVIFVILVLREYKKSVTHWYVLQLAIADSLFLLTLPFKMVEDIHGNWIYSEWMCKGKETLLFLNYYASILFLVVMSIDRYIAVCHTFSTSLQKLRRPAVSVLITAVTWLIALLMCIPIMLYSFKVGQKGSCICRYACHYWTRPRGWTVFNMFNFVVMFLIPFWVMVACYGLIIHRSSCRGRKHSSRSDRDRRRVTIMCASLVACFVFCWLPFHAVHMAKIAGIMVPISRVTLENRIFIVLPVVGSLLAYLNSALNPYLYSFLGTSF